LSMKVDYCHHKSPSLYLISPVHISTTYLVKNFLRKEALPLKFSKHCMNFLFPYVWLCLPHPTCLDIITITILDEE
jgi:hypothetical protein